MNLQIVKVFYYGLALILFTAPCYALSAWFDLDSSRVELHLVVQWQSTENIVVLNPVFSEDHPLFNVRASNTIQEQKGRVTEQRRTYVLDELWGAIPQASVKILNSGKVEELNIGSIQLAQQKNFWGLSVIVLLLTCGLCIILAWFVRRSKSRSMKPEPAFSRETAVQAAKGSNWSLLFEILSSNVPWRSQLGDLPWEQWQQQWQFASREPSDRDRQLLIQLLQQSNANELREIIISEEEQVLSEVLEKQ